MNPSRLFILRPVATILLMVALLGAGLFAYRTLPVAALPTVDYPTIQVTTRYPGAGPDVIADAVTAPLEGTLGRMAGLDQMYAVSSYGQSVVTLRFGLDLPLSVAVQEVQQAINGAARLLPRDLPSAPTFHKVNPADSPVLILVAHSDQLPLTKVQDLVNTRVALKLSQVSGVGQVTLAGGHQAAIRINANPSQLAAHGLTMKDVISTVKANNVIGAKGGFDGKQRSLMLDANGQLRDPAAYGNLVLKYEKGAPLRLKDVATIKHAPENRYQLATANGKPAILIEVRRQPGANVIQLAQQIKQQLPHLRDGLPASVKINVLSDLTTTIRASVDDVQFELMLSIALVIMVTFLFLRSATATLIPALAVPLSLVATFVVMYFCGFSIDNMSLMALTIATGFVIDDAIVVVENISRHLENGKSRLQAALDGSREIAFTILSLTFSLIAVLIPLLFMQDVVGRLFQEFAVTLAAAIGVSLVVSLTLTPMLSARLLSAATDDNQNRFQRWGETQFNRLVALYDRSLNWVLDRQKLMAAVIIGTFLLTGLLYWAVPKGFFPPQDNGLIEGKIVAADGTSFAQMRSLQAQVVKLLRADSAVKSVAAVIGIDRNNSTLNQGHLQIVLKPWGERLASSSDIAQRLRQATAQLAGVKVYLQPGQNLSVDSRQAAGRYQFTLSDLDRQQLLQKVPKLVTQLQQSPAIGRIIADVYDQGRQLHLQLNRSLAARYGITAADIDDALYSAYGQRFVSTIFTQANQYRVILQVPAQYQKGANSLQHIYLKSDTGAMVPLLSIATLSQQSAPLQRVRLDQLPTVNLSFDVAAGYSLEDAQDAIAQSLQTVDAKGQLRMAYQGAAAAFQRATSNTLWLILAALLTMYVVLGVLYESFIHPLTILSTLPPAAIGALLALVLTGTHFTLFALIGVVLLIGIVKKNGILMVDFALQARRDGKSARDAVHQACLLRLRPILMTTFAAMLGAVPLMLAGGTGAALRQPLGLVIVGGLLLSQLLTLYTTPVVYLWFEKLAMRLSHRGEPM